MMAALAFFYGSAVAGGPVLATIKDISFEGLHRKTFTLLQDAEVEIEAVGSGWPDENVLLAYAWLLDLRTRSVAWRMKASECDPVRHDNVRSREQLRLPASDYALYFSALGGSFPIRKKVKFMKLFDLGTVNIHGGEPVEWDRYGRPSEWKVVVRAVDEDFPRDAVARLGQMPTPETLVRFTRVGSLRYHRARLDVHHKVRLRLRAIGEYAAREQSFCDGAWVEDLGTCERIWSMSLTNTEHAGGAKKNRAFDANVILTPGSYMICYASDDSHAYDDWNSQPPYDPDNWGVTLRATEPLPAEVLTVIPDPADTDLIARIDGVGDAEFRRTGFSLSEPTTVCIRAFGEWGRSAKQFLDYGWIENARTLERVWTMKSDEGWFAGGEGRNRFVMEGIDLDAGDYFLCYVTDEAHSAERWHNLPPFDPEAWGITVRGLGPEFSAERVARFDETGGPAVLVRIGPVGDGVHKRLRFEVRERLAVQIIAQGEGARGKMFDYGWLTREDTGEVLWEMMYEDTMHAGGGDKNRYARRTLTLEPGRYMLHYRSDDSHSFMNWNTAPPYEPHLWGVTLIELL
jgi:hypothetical protein